MSLNKDFEQIRENGFNSHSELVSFVDEKTNGFQIDKLKALKKDLALYVENNLWNEVISQYLGERKMSVQELIKKAAKGYKVKGIDSVHEGWAYVFRLINMETGDLQDLDFFIQKKINGSINNKDTSDDKKVNIKRLIEKIAKRRSSNKSAEWSKDMIILYLTVHSEIKDTVKTEREEAIKRCNNDTVKEELINVPKGTLYDLRADFKKKIDSISSLFTE